MHLHELIIIFITTSTANNFNYIISFFIPTLVKKADSIIQSGIAYEICNTLLATARLM